MATIEVETFEQVPKIKAYIKDLRSKNHPEYGDFASLKHHIELAVSTNGLRFFKSSFVKEILNEDVTLRKIGFFSKLYHLIGGAKGVIKFTRKHGISSYSRYKNHNYETVDLLKQQGLLKHADQLYKGPLGLLRLDLVRNVLRMTEDLKNPKILETGCGAGNSIFLLKCLKPDLDVHGFEYTNARLASAIVNLNFLNGMDNLFLADVTKIDLPDNSYDIVFSHHVLEQLGQDGAEKGLREMWRVCKKGVVLSEPSIHKANMYEKWRMRKLGYCQDLLKVAKALPDVKILLHRETLYRSYPNTSYTMVLEKVKSH